MAIERLTQRLCEQAKYEGDGSSTFVLWDERLPGFGLRIAPGGTKSFVIKYTVDGKQRMKRICSADRVPLGRARTLAREYLMDAELGEDPFPQKEAPRPLTCEELCREWLEKYARVHRKNVETPTRRLEQNVISAIGKKPADEVTIQDVAAIARKKGIEEGSRVEANRVVALLGTVYRWGEKRGFVPPGYNPAEGVDRFDEGSRSRILPKEHLATFWAAVEADENPYIGAAIKLMLLTGARRNEILTARWDDLDRQARTIMLRDTKNGTDHTLPLSSVAMSVIDDLEELRQEGNPFLICGHREGTHIKDIRRGWERILKRTDLKNLTRHDLRRSFATHLAGLNHAQPVIEWLLNHKLEGVAEVYTRLHAGSESVRNAVEDYGQWVMRQVHGAAGNVTDIREVRR